jgi:paraquat-inducible protein B
MTEPADTPEVEVRSRRGPSLIWLIPIVAALAGVWLAYRTISERGPQVELRFETADWLEAGKTKIKYKSVEVGLVTDVEITPGGNDVTVTCEFEKHAEPFISEGARFWIVRPRIGTGGVTGLGAILSGAWINLDPGPRDGTPKRQFTGLEQPPPPEADAPGLRLVLHSEELRSLDAGSPVYFREIQVGSVFEHALADDGKTVELRVLIEPEYAERVRKDSRFWNVGGIHVGGSLTNLNVELESLDALIRGGIAFDAPRGDKSPAAESGATFWLNTAQAEIEESALRYGGLTLYLEATALGSLSPGDRVFYREVPVGAVVSHELARDSRSIRVRINIQKRYATLVRDNSVFWNASGISAHLGLHGLEIQTESLEAVLAGGVAFATPDRPGHPVKAGSVFRLRPEYEEEWLAWSPVLWRGPPGSAPKQAPEKGGAIARFFHHGGANEEQSKDHGERETDAAQESAEHKHGFFHRIFGGGDDE